MTNDTEADKLLREIAATFPPGRAIELSAGCDIGIENARKARAYFAAKDEDPDGRLLKAFLEKMVVGARYSPQDAEEALRACNRLVERLEALTARQTSATQQNPMATYGQARAQEQEREDVLRALANVAGKYVASVSACLALDELALQIQRGGHKRQPQ